MSYTQRKLITMKHKEIHKKLLQYIHAELPYEENIKVKRHLQQCNQCRKDVQLLYSIWNSPQSINRVQPSPFLWNKISAQLVNKNQREPLIYKSKIFVLQTSRPALVAAIVIMGLFIGIKLGNHIVISKSSSKLPEITSTQLQNEFGLGNFQLLSSGSLGNEMVTLIDYKNK